MPRNILLRNGKGKHALFSKLEPHGETNLRPERRQGPSNEEPKGDNHKNIGRGRLSHHIKRGKWFSAESGQKVCSFGDLEKVKTIDDDTIRKQNEGERARHPDGAKLKWIREGCSKRTACGLGPSPK